MLALLGRLRAERRHTLVIVEHRLDEVMPLVDRAIVLSADGELVADGPPREVIREHGDWLAEAGVWAPQVSELARSLERSGLALDPFPITVAGGGRGAPAARGAAGRGSPSAARAESAAVIPTRG